MKPTYTTEYFIVKALKVHGFKYNYSLTNYVNAKTKVKIICNNCKNSFEQLAYKHLDKRGCPICCKVGYSKTEWINFCNRKNVLPLIYIIRCFNHNENFIKIGRTSNTVNFRFCGKRFPYSFEIIKEIKGSADFIYDKEIELHKIYKEYKYKPLLDFKGKTECFSLKLLNLI